MILHVTEVLKHAGLIPTGPWYTQEAMDRGTAVHAAIQYAVEGDLDEDSLTPEVAARLRQFGRFRVEVASGRFEFTGCEVEVKHPLGYVGKVDLVAMGPSARWVIDVKPAPAAWHRLQLAAYADALRDQIPVRRANLYLWDEGYAWVERTDRQDFQVFRAALTVALWRVKHGLCDNFRPRSQETGDVDQPGDLGSERAPGP